jgi:hypothetical protein
MTPKHLTALAMAALSLSGCAVHQWAPGPGMSAADFDADKARCSLMARHGGSGFVAYGSPNFVAGATLGNAVGESVRTQQDFNDCMLVMGWKIADQPATAAPAPIFTTDQWDAARKECRETATQRSAIDGVQFPTAFDQCMKARGM